MKILVRAREMQFENTTGSILISYINFPTFHPIPSSAPYSFHIRSICPVYRYYSPPSFLLYLYLKQNK